MIVTVCGSVKYITYYNKENGFAILKLETQDEVITVLGHTFEITKGAYLKIEGTWENHKNFGMQLKAERISITIPQTLDGIKSYLSSGLIKGIGPLLAHKLIQTFGDKVFDIIESHPDLLKSVDGISNVKAQSIYHNWKEQKYIKDIMVFLYSHGISTGKAYKIFKTYGQDSIKIVSENPYRLADDINGVGFLSADKIAMDIGIKHDSIYRAKAGINYVLSNEAYQGNTCLPKWILFDKTKKLLNIQENLLEDVLLQELEAKTFISLGEQQIALYKYYYCELKIAEYMKLLNNNPLHIKIENLEEKILEVQNTLHINLAEQQKEALYKIFDSKIVVITGGPGTGKTTLLKSALFLLKKCNNKTILCAPTGRAAKRLSEATWHKASTIHRLLQFDHKQGRFRYNIDNKLECDALIIDEASMIDSMILYHLLSSIPEHASLIIVGDVNQLPSVGPGQVLKDIIDSNLFSTIILNTIFRQSSTSNIVTNAHRVNQGLMPYLVDKYDFKFIDKQDSESAKEYILSILPKLLMQYDLKDVQVLCPMHKGSCGAKALNSAIQQIINQNQGITIFGQNFALGDKILQLQNNYEKDVFNGDIGIIKDIDIEEQKMTIEFDSLLVDYDFKDLDEITLAYSMTIHKSQGSEYAVVIIPILTEQFALLRKNLLYTAITRAKKTVILIGQQKAIAMAVKSVNKDIRYSMLKTFLMALLTKLN